MPHRWRRALSVAALFHSAGIPGAIVPRRFVTAVLNTDVVAASTRVAALAKAMAHRTARRLLLLSPQQMLLGTDAYGWQAMALNSLRFDGRACYAVCRSAYRLPLTIPLHLSDAAMDAALFAC